ncbi:hypothetical protein O181_018309 [Austropuccinia psidii MF-1]|uniref:Uncharacterized protein n=1 Tax=Austropuccinia psidii MF-1 TaxID=1389203 RepID=A0A9Q3C7G7_9BASI|nr:hypothetical protein [Austropuccinia psidii MF-1]
MPFEPLQLGMKFWPYPLFMAPDLHHAVRLYPSSLASLANSQSNQPPVQYLDSGPGALAKSDELLHGVWRPTPVSKDFGGLAPPES